MYFLDSLVAGELDVDPRARGERTATAGEDDPDLKVNDLSDGDLCGEDSDCSCSVVDLAAMSCLDDLPLPRGDPPTEAFLGELAVAETDIGELLTCDR